MKVLLIGCLSLVFAVPTTVAQVIPLRVNIPFDFHVGEKMMPAGEFYVGRAIPNGGAVYFTTKTSEGINWIRGRNYAIALATYAELRTSRDNNDVTVTFNRYGQDRYFVSAIKYPGGESTFTKSRSELELITSKLIAQAHPVKVHIAGRLIR